MAWDLATAKARLNIVGATQDAQVQAALDTTLDLIELYLDRKLMYAAESASFYYVGEGSLQLPRYPIEQVVSVNFANNNQAISQYKLHKTAGLILFGGVMLGDQVDVSYAGGYKTLPTDLEWAMFAAFDAVWQSSPAFGGTAGSGLVQGTGEVKKVSLVGVGSVDFDVGATAVGSTSSTGNPWGLLPGTVTAVLDRYRNTAPIGLG